MSWALLGGGQLLRRERNATPRDFAPPAVTRVNGSVLLLPHSRDALEAGRRDEEGRLRVPHPEGPEQLEVLGEVEAEVAAGNDRVHALDRDQVVGRERRGGVRGERAAEGSTESASSSTPAAIL